MSTTNGTNNGAKTVATKARLNPGRQWIGIDNIVLDEKFQPRAKTDFDWVHDLSGFRKDGSEFPPVKVYQLPGGRLVAASGHHRVPAMRMAGEDQVLCDVVDGTEEDAIVFAAGSNKGNGVKPMGPKDVTKAVEMLFTIGTWWAKSDKEVSDHVGCSSTKTASIRGRISLRDNRPVPDFVTRTDGKQTPYRRASGYEERKITRSSGGYNNGSTYYEARYKGSKLRGPTAEDVKSQIDEAMNADRRKLSFAGLVNRLRLNMGFESATGRHHQFVGINTYCRRNIICIPCDFSAPSSLPAAIGQLIATRRYKGDLTARMVVLCYPEDGPSKVMGLYRAEGFEFLTPEQLTESLKTSNADPKSED